MILATHGVLASSGGVAIDADAQAFFDRVTTAGGSLTNTEKTAVNNLVIALKANSLWTPMKAIYPMVGASAAACAQNLKSSSFTGTFTSGWTFASTGVTPNGTSAYMNTNCKTNDLTINSDNFGASYYSRSNTAATGNSDFGSTGNNSDQYFQGLIKFTGDTVIYDNRSNASINTTNTNSQGHYVFNTTNSVVNLFKNNSRVQQTTSARTFQPNSLNIFLACRNAADVAKNFSDRECAFFSLHNDGLTDTQASNFYTAVQAFQTTLSRQV